MNTQQQAHPVEAEDTKKKKKKKKAKGADTVIILPGQQQPSIEGQLDFLQPESDNFLMPKPMPTLPTSNRFASLNGNEESVVLPPERESRKSSPSDGAKDGNNNNGKSKASSNTNSDSNSLHLVGLGASGGQRDSPNLASSDRASAEIFVSDEEDGAVEEKEAVKRNEGEEEESIDPDLRKDFHFIYLQDCDRKLENVYLNSFSNHPEKLYNIDVLVVMMLVPEDAEWKDFDNLLPGMVDVRMGWFECHKPGQNQVKTRAIVAFDSAEAADKAASFKKVYWNGTMVPLTKLRNVKNVVPKKLRGKGHE